MLCLILAGGLGTRLREAVPNIPKCLAPINGKPFLHFIITSLRQHNIKDIVLSTGYQAAQVRDYIKQFDCDESIEIIEEPFLLGTGGAIRFAFQRLNCEELMVVNGDTLVFGNLNSLFNPLVLRDSEMARLLLCRKDNCERFGRVVLKSEIVEKFVEKGAPVQGLVHTGVMRLKKEIFEIQQFPVAFSFESDLLPKAILRGAVTGIEIAGDFIDIGVPEDYYRFIDLCAK